MRIAVWEGVVAAGMFACAEAWLAPMIVTWLGGPAQWMAYLFWVPQLLTALIGPFASGLIGHWGGARRVAIGLSFIQGAVLGLMLVPLLLHGQAWLPPWLATGHTLAGIALVLAVIATACGVVVGIAWLSWMGGLVPERVRGPYIAMRTRWFFISKVMTALAFSGIAWALPYAPRDGASGTVWGLVAILAIGATARCVASLMMSRQGEGRVRPPGRPLSQRSGAVIHMTFRRYITGFRELAIARWTLVYAIFNLGWGVSIWAFVPYMQEAAARGGLGLADEPVRFWLLMWLSTLVRIAAYPIAGRLVQRLGAATALRIALPGVVALPFGWAFVTDYWWLLAVEVLSGLAWSIMECGMGMLMFAAHPQQQVRAKLIGYHLGVCALALVIGTVLGQVLFSQGWLPALLGSTGLYTMVFLVSGLLRLPALVLALALLPSRLGDQDRPLVGALRDLPGVTLVDETLRDLIAMLRGRR